MNPAPYREMSLFISCGISDRLHLKRFCGNEKGIPILLLHGSIENGRIFYSASGKGLAPYLASLGYDVFIPDLRGKGLSTPSINRKSSYGVFETITEEIPLFLEKIKELKGDQPMHWMAHSWGGVLLLCYYARYLASNGNVLSITFFGTKRRISIRSVRKFMMADVIYGFLFLLIGKIKGYVDAGMIVKGSDNETLKTNRQTWHWVKDKKWIDQDGFNYGRVLPGISLPPAMYIAGLADDVLGHPTDVQLLMQETGSQQINVFYLASKKNGNLHNYGHINLLTHPDAVHDHFPEVITWLRKNEKRNGII